MKTKILPIIGVISFFIIGVIVNVSAQKINIKVTESTEKIGGGKNSAFVVSIYDTDPEDIQSKWKSEMKGYKAKVSIKDEVFADNAVITAINGNNTIDVYAKTEKMKDGEVKFIVAFDLGGAFLSSSSSKDKYEEAKKMISDFAIKTTKESIAGQRKAAEKVLDKIQDQQHDLEKQQTKLNSSIEDYKAKIEDYQKRIKDAQADLEKNKADQEKKKKEVTDQKKVVETVTAKENAVQ
ncbi:MAG: hypothetical protein ACHQHP_03825 [Bacteroidia bacterium]